MEIYVVFRKVGQTVYNYAVVTDKAVASQKAREAQQHPSLNVEYVAVEVWKDGVKVREFIAYPTL